MGIKVSEEWVSSPTIYPRGELGEVLAKRHGMTHTDFFNQSAALGYEATGHNDSGYDMYFVKSEDTSCDSIDRLIRFGARQQRQDYHQWLPGEAIDEAVQDGWVRVLEEGMDPTKAGRYALQAIADRHYHERKATAAYMGNGHSARDDLSSSAFAELESHFLRCRSKRGRRGEEAARRDSRIVSLICQGYSDVGIAQEIGCAEKSIPRYRYQIRKVLAQIANP